jgi:predicted DNA-binding protein
MAKRKARKEPREELTIISFRAPLSLQRQLDHLAQRARRTQSSYLRVLLEDVLKKLADDAATA